MWRLGVCYFLFSLSILSSFLIWIEWRGKLFYVVKYNVVFAIVEWHLPIPWLVYHEKSDLQGFGSDHGSATL